MGRTPAPTRLKVLKGERKDRVNDAEPVPGELEVVVPSEVAADPVASGEWDRLAPDLIAKRVLTAWDSEAFGDYCLATARAQEAYRHLRAEGEVIDQDVFARDGAVTGSKLVRSPWSMVLRDALAVKAQRSARFGLTPSDRSQIKQEAPGGKSDGKDLLTG